MNIFPNITPSNYSLISRKEVLLLFISVFVISIARLSLFYGVPIHPDEAYYWVWSTRLEASYYDINPGIAYYIKLFTLLLGDTYMAFKVGACSASILTMIFTYLSAREAGLNSRLSALVIFTMTILPSFFIGSLLLLPDTGLLLAWSASLYLSLRYMRRQEIFIFYCLCIFLGLGFLFKQTMAAFVIALGIWYIFSYKEYPLFKSKHFYLGILLAALSLLPILIWNIKNDWGQALAMKYHRPSTSPNASWGLLFQGQLATLNFTWYIAFLAICLRMFLYSIPYLKKMYLSCETMFASYLNRKKQTSTTTLKNVQNSKNTFSKINATHSVESKVSLSFNQILEGQWKWLWCNALIFHILFLSIAHKRSILANWLFPSYFAILILLVSFFPYRKEMYTFQKWFYRPLLFLGFLTALVVNLYAPQTKKSLEYFGIHISPQLILKNLNRGYREIIEEIVTKRKEKDSNAGILSITYQDAALAHWYLPNHEYVHALSILSRTQYSYWPGVEQGKNYFIYISLKSRIDDFYLDRSIFSQLCEKMEDLGRHTINIDGEPLKGYQLWYCKNYKQDWYPLYQKNYEDLLVKFMPGLSEIMTLPHTKKELEYWVRPWSLKSYPKHQTKDKDDLCREKKKLSTPFEKIKAFIKNGSLGVCHEIYSNEK